MRTMRWTISMRALWPRSLYPGSGQKQYKRRAGSGLQIDKCGAWTLLLRWGTKLFSLAVCAVGRKSKSDFKRNDSIRTLTTQQVQGPISLAMVWPRSLGPSGKIVACSKEDL